MCSRSGGTATPAAFTSFATGRAHRRADARSTIPMNPTLAGSSGDVSVGGDLVLTLAGQVRVVERPVLEGAGGIRDVLERRVHRDALGILTVQERSGAGVGRDPVRRQPRVG